MSQPNGTTQDSPTVVPQGSTGDAPNTPPQVGAYAPPAAVPQRSSGALRSAEAEELKDAQDGPGQVSAVTADSVGPVMLWSLTAFFAFVVIFATDVLLSVWPPSGAPDGPQVGVPVLWGLVSLKITVNDRLMLITILMGVIGSMIHVLTSFADFAGNRQLTKSWIPWYLVRPVIGSGLALFFYVVFRGGLMTGNDAANVNPFGIAAVGGLAGMFSKQATDKLSEVFSTMFNVSAANGDAQRGGKLEPTAPAPTAAVAPDSEH